MSPEQPPSPAAPRWRGQLATYAVGLGATVLATAIAVNPFIDTTGRFLLFLGAVMVAAWYVGFKAAQVRAAHDEAILRTPQPPGAPADRQPSRSAQDLQPELEILSRLGLT